MFLYHTIYFNHYIINNILLLLLLF